MSTAVGGTCETKSLPSVLTASWVRSLESWQRNTSRYWTDALRAGKTPVEVAADAMRWTSLVLHREAPRWASPNRVVWQTPVARLRDFTPDSSADTPVVPTLLLPPQAGHDSCIVDFSRRQSQLVAVREAGLVRAWSLDWVGATRETRHLGIEDYIDTIQHAVDDLGGRVNLIGDCQGGWLATIYAALRPEHINTLTIAGAPIDFHAGEPLIHKYLQVLAPGGNLTFYKAVVAMSGGLLPGDFMLTSFKALKPEAELERHLQLLANIDSPAEVERYQEFSHWFDWTQNIPGDFYLWIVEHLFANNELLAGTLRVGDETVDLSRISCPLNLMAGQTDHITPAAQVWALADAVSTPPHLVKRHLTSGGHLGLFMGTEALTRYWPGVMRDVYRHSVSDPSGDRQAA